MASATEAHWRPKAILFDLLTALLDSWSTWSSALSSLTPSSLSSARSMDDLALIWRKRYLELTFTCGKYVPYESLVAKSAADVGLPSEAAKALTEKWTHLKPWPEVGDVLKKLRAKGYKLGIVTNCSKVLGQVAVDRVGLEGGFDAAVTAEDAGYYKPQREAYQAGIDALGFQADEVLFVAGSSGDVVGAAEAGMKVVWNNHIGLEPKPGANPLREGKSLDEALAEFL